MKQPPLTCMIGGAQKAGTSSVMAYLAQHPELCLHRSRELTLFVNDELYARGYDAIAADEYDCTDQQRRIAKSAGVLYLPEALDRLHAHNPQIKLLFFLRHPVDRAYSSFWFARQMGWEPLTSFEQAIEAGPDRFEQDWVRQRNTDYLGRGEYARHLKQVFSRFSAEQVRVYLVEDLKADSSGLCREIFGWLNVDATFEPDVTRRQNVASLPRSQALASAMSSGHPLKRIAKTLLPRSMAQNIKKRLRELNAQSFTPPPMDTNLRKRLTDRYRQANDELASLIGRNLQHWNEG